MLSDEWIMDMVSQQCTAMLDGKQKEISPTTIARAIEAEVRKQDDALIRQMHDALKNCRATGALDDQAHALASTAITAARARLGEKT